MSMSIILGEIKTIANKASANYVEMSDGIVVTDFIDTFLEGFISDFKTYEDDDEIIYKEIDHESIETLSLKVKDYLLSTIKDISSDKNENIGDRLNDIYDSIELNNLFLEYYKSTCNSDKNIKLMIV